jgi:hypothetical protein
MQGPKRTPFQIIFGFLGALIKWILVIGVFVGLIFLIYTGLTGGFKTGFFQYVYEKGATLANKMPIFAPLVDVFKTIRDPTRTIRTFDWQADVDKNSQSQELGLTFQRFTSLKKTYLPGEPLSFVGSVKVASLKDDSKVTFTCDATTDKINGNIQPSEPFVLSKDSTQVFSIRCEVPAESIKLETKKIKAETVVLKADYDFKTDAYVEAYTMSKRVLTEKQNNQEDVFENENNPRLNKQTGEVKSQYTAGPMKILINSEYSQPFTELGPFSSNSYYSLGIIIEKANSFYQGKLNKINNVYLYLPKNFELNDKENQFELINAEDEIFNKYQLKQDKIDKLNLICKEPNLFDVECQNYWERGFILALTNFKISSLNKEDLDKNYIRSEVEYEFQAQTSQVVTIVGSIGVA